MSIENAFEILVEVLDRHGAQLVENTPHFDPIVGIWDRFLAHFPDSNRFYPGWIVGVGDLEHFAILDAGHVGRYVPTNWRLPKVFPDLSERQKEDRLCIRR